MANGALEGKDLLIGTTQDEMTAFFAFEPRIQSLTRESALHLLAGRFGPSTQDVFQCYASEVPHATPAQVFIALQTDALPLRHVRQLPRQPDVGAPSDTELALGWSFATAVAAFVATGSASDWLPYAPAATARIRHFG